MIDKKIIRMAEESGLLNPPQDGLNWSAPLPNINYLQRIELFADLVAVAERDRIADEAKHIIKRAEARGAAAEREACARVCETEGIGAKYQGDVYAVAIRARGEK